MAYVWERAWLERADLNFSSCQSRTANSCLLWVASCLSARPWWRMSPNRHAVNTSRDRLATIVSPKALRRLAFLSLSNLVLLVSASESEERSPRDLSMYSLPSLESTSMNARWRYPCWRKLIERSISACFDFAND